MNRKMKLLAALIVLVTVLGSPAGMRAQIREPGERVGEQTEHLIQALLDQGVTPDCIHGVDPDGIPLICENGGLERSGATPPVGQGVRGLPVGTRGWEVIPSVIRNDGVETFRVEVDTNGPVAGVQFDWVNMLALIPPQEAPVPLRDDGLGEDQVAGDFIYTSGLFRYKVGFPMYDHFWDDPASPAGLNMMDIGGLTILETSRAARSFLVGPRVGVLRADIPDVDPVSLSPDVQSSAHLVNIRGSNHETQRFLRNLGSNINVPTEKVYAVLPDLFDFFVFFSTDKVEHVPNTSTSNFNAGMHLTVQVNYDGTGNDRVDFSDLFGSSGRLLGINVLDTYKRGTYSANATHEIIHQWVSRTSQSLGLTDSSGWHYLYTSSVGSLVGGFRWVDQGNGTYVRNCSQGRNGAHHAAELDKYMMGLIAGSAVAPLLVEYGSPSVCVGEVISSYYTVTMADIQAQHGVRTPGPAEAKRAFSIAFAIESHDRLLNPTEMTYFDILAAHYTREIPSRDPDPYIGFNWAPIERFFGEGTEWRSALAFEEVYLPSCLRP